MYDLASSLDVDLTPQQILEKINMNIEEYETSMNPSDLIDSINRFDSRIDEDPLSAFNSDLMDIVGPDDFTKSQISNGAQAPQEIKPDLNNILDELIEDEDSVNAVRFNPDEANLFELEDISTDDLIHSLDTEIPESREEIQKKLRDRNKKVGSQQQKRVDVLKLYDGNKHLLYKDEGQDLTLTIKHKLFSYWDIIVDFDDVLDISDAFLRGAFGDLCQWLHPDEILERVELVNIPDRLVLNVFKQILPNSYKWWLNELNLSETNVHFKEGEHKINKDLVELINRGNLEKEGAPLICTPKELNLTQAIYEEGDETIPSELMSHELIDFKRISAKFLGRKREKKLKYPIYFVENTTQEVIDLYNLDRKIESYIETQLICHINWNEVKENSNCQDTTDKRFKYQFPPELFDDIFKFVQSLLLEACSSFLENLKDEILSLRKELNAIKSSLPDKILDKFGNCFQTVYIGQELIGKLPEELRIKLRRLEDLEFSLMDKEHKYLVKEDILLNIFEIVDLSLYPEGLDKVKLIAYHYLGKTLEKLSIGLWDKLPRKSVRGYRVPLEMFRFEMVSVLIHDLSLRRFVFTIKELIAKWVFKYGQTSAMASFYYDIMMITPQVLEENILRYVAITAIKNKNPMTLRAVFSAYISLIHTAIFMSLNSKITKRYGFFKKIDEMVQDGFYGTSMVEKSSNKLIEPNLLVKTFMYKNPKVLREDFNFIQNVDLYPIVELNSLDMYDSKPKDINTMDWWWLYTKFIRFTKSESKFANSHKIRTKFLKSDKRNSQLEFIRIITWETLREPIYQRIGDYDCADEILGVISEDISIRMINRGYLNSDYKLVVRENTEYLTDIHSVLKKLGDTI